MDGEKLYEGAYRFADFGPMGKVYVYLLIGKERAVLIDSGYGRKRWDLIVEKYTDKPVTVLLTHAHIDHALGSQYFDDVYFHEADEKIWHESNNKEILRRVFEAYSIHSFSEVDGEELLPLSTVVTADRRMPKTFSGKMQFDLGDRKITVVHTPGHSQGSCCFIDEEKGACFTGDTLSKAVWLQLRESTPLETFEDSLLTLKKAMQEKGVTTIYPAHCDRLPAIQTAEKYLQLIEAISQGKDAKKPLNDPVVPGVIHSCGEVMIVLPQ